MNVVWHNNILHEGLKKFGEEGEKVIGKEVEQLHNCTCWVPISKTDMNANKQRRAQVALAHLSEKSSGKIKGQLVYNGKLTRECLGKEDSASPTASMEAIFLMCIIDTYEYHDVMSADAPNAFVQAVFPREPDKDRTTMKITGRLVDTLVNTHLETHKNYVVVEKGKQNLIYQDNNGAILLENNRKVSSSKRARPINIQYFMVTDLVKKGQLDIVYCPIDNMIGDYFAKASQGTKCSTFWKIIMGK